VPDTVHYVVAAIIGGGLVTAWKWLAGWQRINLSLQLGTRRTRSSDPLWHDLVCVVKLKKGDRATLLLDSVTMIVQSGQTTLLNYSVPEVHAPEANRSLNITPGEETHFAAYCRAPKDAVCIVTATVTGRSLAWRRTPVAVWKATEVSVPYLREP